VNERFDVAIIGSGFSGSILARILASRGRRVALIDAASHPRFAIGESSTPIADLLLRQLGAEYGLDDLIALSSYGTWQQRYPHLSCGKKRGFSYFDHRVREGEAIRNSQRAIPKLEETYLGERSLLVAASPTDARSDTHWYRAEVDTHLHSAAVKVGVRDLSGRAVVRIDRGDPVTVVLDDGETLEADFLVDASGRSAVVAERLNHPEETSALKTRSCSVFGHFRGVKTFSGCFDDWHRDERAHQPFDADDAAQHHLIEGGWVWMLRMNNGVTSVGVTLAGDSPATRATAWRLYESRFAQYPTLAEVFGHAKFVTPKDGPIATKRLQRFYDPVIAPHILMLPTSALTLDPLHSTGIAHALVGVQRIARMLLHGNATSAVASYRRQVRSETRQLDRLVHLAYECLPCFRRFTAACMLYFAAAIGTEERLAEEFSGAETGESAEPLWFADDAAFDQAVRSASHALTSRVDWPTVALQVRQSLEPWNSAGLMDPSVCNRYAYTATK
jgi:FADH2 O2-dependent halogenase